VFTLEYGLNVDINDGIGESLARQQFIGLSHNKLGTVALGRQYAPGFGAMIRNDALVASDGASAIVQMNRAGANTIYAASPARIDNSITYSSPNWSGFTVSGIYGFGASNNVGEDLTGTNGISTGSNGFAGAGLNYANGPLNLDLVYHTRQGTTVANANTATRDSINEWMLGGSYDFKVVKLYATYQDQNDNNGTSATEGGNKAYSVGATMPVFGNGKIHASYAHLSWDRTGAGDSRAWALGYTHALSKRTTLYTTYTNTRNDDDAVVAAGAVAKTRALGETNYVFTAGINHTF